jgi:pyochelin synthetase
MVTELCTDEGAWRPPVDIPLPVATRARRAEANTTAGPLPDGLLQDRVLAKRPSSRTRPAGEQGSEVT